MTQGETVAVRLGECICQAGYRYAKAEIMIAELVPQGAEQRALWGGAVEGEGRAECGAWAGERFAS